MSTVQSARILKGKAAFTAEDCGASDVLNDLAKRIEPIIVLLVFKIGSIATQARGHAYNT